MAIGLDPGILAGLHRDPDAAVEGRLNGAGYCARITIPDYGARVEKHYGRKLGALAIDFPSRHFDFPNVFANKGLRHGGPIFRDGITDVADGLGLGRALGPASRQARAGDANPPRRSV